MSVGNYTPALASGSLATIFGQNLAVRPSSSPGFPLATRLGGVTVTADGQPVPLPFMSPSQINVQIPYEVSGQVNLQISTANGTASVTIPVVPLAPSILAITVQNAYCTPSNPALQSGNVTVYATGLGAAASPVATGQAAPLVANPMAVPVQVWLGNTNLQPSYAGVAPGFAGLSQINFAVPAGLPDGVYPLRIGAGSASSQPQNLVVGAAAGATPKMVLRPGFLQAATWPCRFCLQAGNTSATEQCATSPKPVRFTGDTLEIRGYGMVKKLTKHGNSLGR